jgi:hypothetical protein
MRAVKKVMLLFSLIGLLFDTKNGEVCSSAMSLNYYYTIQNIK